MLRAIRPDIHWNAEIMGYSVDPLPPPPRNTSEDLDREAFVLLEAIGWLLSTEPRLGVTIDDYKKSEVSGGEIGLVERLRRRREFIAFILTKLKAMQ
jgi:hypothetical protein